MTDVDHVNILARLLFEIAFDKVEKSGVEKKIFLRAVKNAIPTVLTGLMGEIHNQICTTVNFIGNNSQSGITDIFSLILVKEFQGWCCVILVGFCLQFMKSNAFFKYIE